MSQRIRFYIRVCPDERNGPESFEVGDDRKVIWLSNSKCTAMTSLPYIKFRADEIFTDACQAYIYDTVIGKDLASLISKGEDVTLLAYGPSGTGKTFTMTGIRNNYHFRGIVPRLLEALFELRQKKDFTLKINALEFINGTCYNLLSHPLQEVDCRKLTGERVKFEHDAMELLFKLEAQRKSVSNQNCGSMVLTFFIKPLQRSQKTPITQKINLIDTSGSEVHWGKMPDSACSLQNNSGSKIVCDSSNDWAYLALKASKGRLRPNYAFRNCKMVGYLCNSLRSGSIRLIGHISRSWDSHRYTLATLRFGSQMIGKTEELSSREIIGPSSMTINQSLENEIQRLRDELAVTDLLENGFVPASVQMDTSNLAAKVENYLRSPEAESCADLMTVAHPITVLGTFKTIYRKCLDELKEEYYMGDVDETPIVKLSSRKPSKSGKKNSSVQVLDDGTISNLAEIAEYRLSRQSKQLPLSKDVNSDIAASQSQEIAKLNRNTYWKEFLSRHPYWHRKLKANIEDMKSARDDQQKVESRLKDLNKRLQENKTKVERATWERLKDVGNPVDAKGQILLSDDEKTALDEQQSLHDEHKKLTEKLMHVHNHFMNVAYRFIEANETASKSFTEYMATTYSNVLILPGGEEYEETVPILVADLSKKPTMTESEETFVHLQKKHLYRDRRDPPHPRWP